jgi:hypothetical protein
MLVRLGTPNGGQLKEVARYVAPSVPGVQELVRFAGLPTFGECRFYNFYCTYWPASSSSVFLPVRR